MKLKFLFHQICYYCLHRLHQCDVLTFLTTLTIYVRHRMLIIRHDARRRLRWVSFHCYQVAQFSTEINHFFYLRYIIAQIRVCLFTQLLILLIHICYFHWLLVYLIFYRRVVQAVHNVPKVQYATFFFWRFSIYRGSMIFMIFYSWNGAWFNLDRRR